MQKDVIYIDVEDDITAIIGKLKASKHKIIALVPPKRIGVLQSAVNLRLLARSAEQHDKRLVIITGNHALSSLAASAAIPVAKNLQSKPELAEIAALEVDDGEDVIDGAALPVGEHAKQSSTDEGVDTPLKPTPVPKAAAAPAAAAAKGKKGAKVPNFDSFRKKLVIGISAGILLIAFFVWAIFFAPHAKIILLARTTDASVSQQVTLTTSADSSAKDMLLHAEQKQIAKDVSIEFEATGKKEVGEKATGSVLIKTSATTILVAGLTVPAGTEIAASNGKTYVTTAAAVFAQGDASGLDGRTVGVTASERGAASNGAAGAATTSASGVTSVQFVDTTAGGTDKTISVVTKEDVDKAKKQAEEGIDKDQLKKDLTTQFGDKFKVIDDSFELKLDGLKAAPVIDAEATNGKGTYAGSAVATLYAVSTDAMGSYLDAVLEQQMDNKDQQRVYENGASAVKFDNFVRDDKKVSVNIAAAGKIGPKIDEAKIKEAAMGKNYGEIQSSLTSINGVAEADIKFSPFWVNRAPNDVDRITIEFKVDE